MIFSSTPNYRVLKSFLNRISSLCLYFLLSTVVHATPTEQELSDLIVYLSEGEPQLTLAIDVDNLNSGLSRAEATAELDAFLSKTVPAFKINPTPLINTFADVPDSDWYVPSLLRLAYYHGIRTETVVTKENENFRPFDKVSRQEFVAMVVRGLNIPIESGTLYIESFNDFNEDVWATWAKPFFNTAVKYGLIVGNDSYLYPERALTIKESLYILAAAKKAFDGNYQHNGDGFYNNDSIILEQRLAKRIGFDYIPEYFIDELTGIDITDITVREINGLEALSSCGVDNNVVKLTAVIEETDSDERIQPYYWWRATNGYFRQFASDTRFKT